MERETTSCILHICRGRSRRAWYCGGAGQRDWKGIVWQGPSLARRRAGGEEQVGPSPQRVGWGPNWCGRGGPGLTRCEGGRAWVGRAARRDHHRLAEGEG